LPEDTPADLPAPAGDDAPEPVAADAAPTPVEIDVPPPEVRARVAEARVNEVVAAYRQLKQEMEGFRDRLMRDAERRFANKREQFLMPFIEILDNLERALEAAQQSGAHTSLLEGLILVRTQLLQTLQGEGLTWIPVRGLPYDPECSEVVDMRPVDDPAHDQVVIQELQRGYRLNGRIVRHSQVVVGQYSAPGVEVVGTPNVDAAEETRPAAEPSAEASEASTGAVDVGLIPPPDEPKE
jgi:molecular chaperone GrpE